MKLITPRLKLNVNISFPLLKFYTLARSPVASFTKEDNRGLAKRQLKTNGHLANRQLTSLVKEATAAIWFLANIRCAATLREISQFIIWIMTSAERKVYKMSISREILKKTSILSVIAAPSDGVSWLLVTQLLTVKHIEAETKWTPFRRRHFQVHFLEWKCLNSD